MPSILSLNSIFSKYLEHSLFTFFNSDLSFGVNFKLLINKCMYDSVSFSGGAVLSGAGAILAQFPQLRQIYWWFWRSS